MKILCLIDRLCTPGGAERQLVTLARALTDRGHECTIAALFPGSDLASKLPSWGIGFQELGVSSRRNLIGAGMKVARLIRKSKFDVVQAHLISSAIASGLSRMLFDGPPRVVVLHDLDFKADPPKSIRKKAFVSMHLFCLRRLTDGIVAVSDSIARYYKKEMGIDCVTPIPNSIELGNPAETFLVSREKMRGELALGNETGTLVCSARMVEQKGHFVLLRAMELLSERGMTPKLILIGKGPLEVDIRKAIKAAGLESRVIMTGNISYENALRHMAAADLYVSPSLQEGFGLALAEAMALGVPPVATAVDGVLKLVEDGVSGLLVPPGDPEALASAVAHVLTDRDLRRRFGRSASERIQTQFSPAAIAEQWESYLGELVASRPC